MPESPSQYHELQTLLSNHYFWHRVSIVRQLLLTQDYYKKQLLASAFKLLALTSGSLDINQEQLELAWLCGELQAELVHIFNGNSFTKETITEAMFFESLENAGIDTSDKELIHKAMWLVIKKYQLSKPNN